MSKMELEMLYATYGDRVDQLLLNLPESSDKLKIIIVHQVDDVSHNAQHLFSHRSDVKYFMMLDKGVSKSRNFALQQATGDIILFCDDDVTYSDGFIDSIIDEYVKDSEVDSITFSYSTPTSGVLSKFKSYPYRHNLRSILSVGTIEVSARLAGVKRVGAFFPEDLGAGSKFYCCDEPVFLSRLIKSGLVVEYRPISICTHPDISSGLSIDNYEAIMSRLICFRYIYGYLSGSFLFFLFSVKNHRRLSPKYILMSFFSILIVKV